MSFKELETKIESFCIVWEETLVASPLILMLSIALVMCIVLTVKEHCIGWCIIACTGILLIIALLSAFIYLNVRENLVNHKQEK